jgi:hypothetical protein
MTRTRQYILALTFSVLGLTAFDNSSRQRINKDKTVAVEATEIAVAMDSIDYSYFPVDSTFTTKVLTVGTFHSDEVWDGADREKWFGLFRGKTGYYIAETKIKTQRINDDILDKAGEKTGWKVQTVKKDTSIILMGRLSFLRRHNLNRAVLSKDQIFPSDTVRITYLGIDYNLYATGGKKKLIDNPDWFEVWNYKLFMTATIKGQIHKSLLVSQPNFDDQMINIIFAGDIDGDGILDLVIDTSRHYNATSPTIYLSRPAEKGEIVKPVGGHTSVGC